MRFMYCWMPSAKKSAVLSLHQERSILQVTVALEVILEFWKKEEIARSKIFKAGAVMSGGLNDLKPCEFPNLCEGERCRDG